MANAKKPFVVQNFTQDTWDKANALILQGKLYAGGFWKNRTKTAVFLKYESWEKVPEETKKCVNYIGARAVRRQREERQVFEEGKPRHTPKGKPQQLLFVTRPLVKGFVLTKDILDDIYSGAFVIPHEATREQLMLIRTYITIQSGFDPKRLLLGVASHMQK